MFVEWSWRKQETHAKVKTNSSPFSSPFLFIETVTWNKIYVSSLTLTFLLMWKFSKYWEIPKSGDPRDPLDLSDQSHTLHSTCLYPRDEIGGWAYWMSNLCPFWITLVDTPATSTSLPSNTWSFQSVANNFSDERIQIWILFAKDIFYNYEYEYYS